MKKTFLLIGSALLVCALLWTIFNLPRTGSATALRQVSTPLPPEVQQARRDAIEQALIQAVARNQENVLAFVVYSVSIDYIDYSDDGTVGLVWLALTDPQTGRQLATEPGLGIARQVSPSTDGVEKWEVLLQSDKGWEEAFLKLPPEFLEREYIQTFYRPPEEEVKASTQALSGYRLPWAGGQGKYLEGSIGHFLVYDPPSCSETACRYAYDFADGTMFPLRASRGGAVYHFWDTCSNGDPNCSNYLVIKDESRVPTTYQLYLHMAYNSIPVALKHEGALVVQGQFIGNVDDTGYSTGHHLHFHVFTTPPVTYWGNSIDITFDDVTVNGGRPRTWYEATTWPQYGNQWVENDYYVSGNAITNPPTGGLSLPTAYNSINTSTLTFSGWGTDDLGISRFQVIASTDNGDNWMPIGSSQTANPFTASIDLCDAGIPDGPVLLALRIWDYDGNMALGYPGLRPIIKNHECSPPPPACVPGSSQISVYTGIDYTGICRYYNLGDYSTLDASFSDKINSIQVGANVMAEVYDYINFGRRTETFIADDPNLADHRISANRISSLRVVSRGPLPAAPLLKIPRSSSADLNPSALESLILTWKGGDGATEFNSTLVGPGVNRSTGWQKNNVCQVGSLPPGDYTWTVTARNSNGEASGVMNFSVFAGELPNYPPLTPNWSDDVESGPGNWTASGLWHIASVSLDNRTSMAWIFNDGVDYGHSSIGAGDLTSPPITIPAGGAYLRFDSYADLGDRNPNWDQRWVQVAPVGGVFTDLYQMDDDEFKHWVSSPAINLAAYAGQTIRLRFHFDIVDELYNGEFPGWMLDNISVTTTAPNMSCAETPAGNDTPATATPFNLNNTLSAYICPVGDVDYYSFQANAGDYIYANIDAKTIGSSLDSYIYLLEADTLSVVAFNDDEAPGQLDSSLKYTISHDGTYYLKVKAWNHPGAGGPAYFYDLTLQKDSSPPTASITFPFGAWMPVNPFIMTADAADVGDGELQRVDFYWHSTNWSSDHWVLLGSDTDGSDGWQVNVDPTTLGSLAGTTLLVQAVDHAGRTANPAYWNIVLENTPPTVTMQSLPPTSDTSAFILRWSASDNLSGVNTLDLQVNKGSGWVDAVTGIPAGTTEMWYVGLPGENLSFRMRATDRANNVSAYPTSAQATTTITAACTPDTYEDDDSYTTASNLPWAVPTEHNICTLGDNDWAHLQLEAGKNYRVMALPLGGGAAANLTLYASDGSTVVASQNASGFAQSTILTYISTASGDYYLRVAPWHDNLAGNGVRYSLQVDEIQYFFLPFIGK